MNVTYVFAKCEYGCTLWLSDPEETSPEVQNMGISGPLRRRACVNQIFLKIYTWFFKVLHTHIKGTWYLDTNYSILPRI